MQTTVIATKMMNGRVVTRKFGKYSWDLLGKDKNGWVENPSETIQPDIILPPKGETKAPVKIEVKAPEPEIIEIDQLTKNEFTNAVSKIGKGNIKDYFDKAGVVYSNTSNIIEIRTQLAVLLNYDIKKLNEAFK